MRGRARVSPPPRLFASAMLSGRVAILMVDDREVGSPSPSGTTLAYPSLAFALNAEYACKNMR